VHTHIFKLIVFLLLGLELFVHRL